MPENAIAKAISDTYLAPQYLKTALLNLDGPGRSLGNKNVTGVTSHNRGGFRDLHGQVLRSQVRCFLNGLLSEKLIDLPKQ